MVTSLSNFDKDWFPEHVIMPENWESSTNDSQEHYALIHSQSQCHLNRPRQRRHLIHAQLVSQLIHVLSMAPDSGAI